jgi:hypothetical protein
MRRSVARLSASVPSRHTQFSVAFTANIVESNFRYTQALLWLIDHVEETRRVLGREYWTYGVEENHKVWNTFCDYQVSSSYRPAMLAWIVCLSPVDGEYTRLRFRIWSLCVKKIIVLCVPKTSSGDPKFGLTAHTFGLYFQLDDRRGSDQAV